MSSSQTSEEALIQILEEQHTRRQLLKESKESAALGRIEPVPSTDTGMSAAAEDVENRDPEFGVNASCKGHAAPPEMEYPRTPSVSMRVANQGEARLEAHQEEGNLPDDEEDGASALKPASSRLDPHVEADLGVSNDANIIISGHEGVVGRLRKRRGNRPKTPIYRLASDSAEQTERGPLLRIFSANSGVLAPPPRPSTAPADTPQVFGSLSGLLPFDDESGDEESRAAARSVSLAGAEEAQQSSRQSCRARVQQCLEAERQRIQRQRQENLQLCMPASSSNSKEPCFLNIASMGAIHAAPAPAVSAAPAASAPHDTAAAISGAENRSDSGVTSGRGDRQPVALQAQPEEECGEEDAARVHTRDAAPGESAAESGCKTPEVWHSLYALEQGVLLASPRAKPLGSPWRHHALAPSGAGAGMVPEGVEVAASIVQSLVRSALAQVMPQLYEVRPMQAPPTRPPTAVWVGDVGATRPAQTHRRQHHRQAPHRPVTACGRMVCVGSGAGAGRGAGWLQQKEVVSGVAALSGRGSFLALGPDPAPSDDGNVADTPLPHLDAPALPALAEEGQDVAAAPRRRDLALGLGWGGEGVEGGEAEDTEGLASAWLRSLRASSAALADEEMPQPGQPWRGACLRSWDSLSEERRPATATRPARAASARAPGRVLRRYPPHGRPLSSRGPPRGTSPRLDVTPVMCDSDAWQQRGAVQDGPGARAGEAAGVAGAAQRGDEMLVRGRKAGQREMRKLSVRTNYKVPSEDVSPYFKGMTPQESAQVSAGLSGRCCIPEHATTPRDASLGAVVSIQASGYDGAERDSSCRGRRAYDCIP